MIALPMLSAYLAIFPRSQILLLPFPRSLGCTGVWPLVGPWLRELSCPGGLRTWSHSVIQATRRGRPKLGLRPCATITYYTSNKGPPRPKGRSRVPAGRSQPLGSQSDYPQRGSLNLPSVSASELT